MRAPSKVVWNWSQWCIIMSWYVQCWNEGGSRLSLVVRIFWDQVDIIWRTLQLSPKLISRHLLGLYWCCVNLRAGKSMVLLKIKILCRAIKWTRKIIQTDAHPQNLPGTVEKGVLGCPEVFKLKIRPGKGFVYILGGHNVKKSRYMRTLRSCPNSAQRCIMMSWYVQNWNGSW